jgi:hypothetical protein
MQEVNGTAAHVDSATLPIGSARGPALRTILIAGCTAATIDLLFAFAFFGWQLGITPIRVLQSVASGFFGTASYSGGATTAAIGFIAHYSILIVAASFFWFASRRLPFLVRWPIVAGMLFGVCVYCAMTFVIVPLSAARMRALSWSAVTIGQFLIHPVLGVAIALIVRQSEPAKKP